MRKEQVGKLSNFQADCNTSRVVNRSMPRGYLERDSGCLGSSNGGQKRTSSPIISGHTSESQALFQPKSRGQNLNIRHLNSSQNKSLLEDVKRARHAVRSAGSARPDGQKGAPLGGRASPTRHSSGSWWREAGWRPKKIRRIRTQEQVCSSPVDCAPASSKCSS